MKYSKKRKSQIYNYYSIEQASIFHRRDLGIYFVSPLSFNEHCAHILNWASSTLRFIYRICSDFINLKALKSLYRSFVYSLFDYNSVA